MHDDSSGPADPPAPESIASRARVSLRGLFESRAERAAWWTLLVACVALRIVACFRLPAQSDEPQHLHVTWVWSHGWAPYRDVLDNHVPLFHVLTAPILALVGERDDALAWMRLAMVPLALATAWGAAICVRAAAGARAAAWGVLVAAFEPHLFALQTEFRSDQLWAALSVLALAVLVGGIESLGRSVLFGVLLGAAACASLKTVLIVAALALAASILAGLGMLAPAWAPGSRWRGIAAVLGGFALVPLLTVGLLAHRGALSDCATSALRGPVAGGRSAWEHPALLLATLPLLVAATLVTRWSMRRAGERALHGGGWLVALATFVYAILATTAWPLYTRQDALPAAAIASGLLAAIVWRAVPPRIVAPLATVVVIVLGGLAVARTQPWRDGLAEHERWIANVRALVRPDERVIDAKGEAVFRRRALSRVYETVTRAELAVHPELDRLREEALAARACVATPDLSSFPCAGREFVLSAFVDVGGVRVAGSRAAPLAAGESRSIDVRVPALYRVWSDADDAGATLDGIALPCTTFLAGGEHVIAARRPSGPIVLEWSRAFDLGYRPIGDSPAPPSESHDAKLARTSSDPAVMRGAR